MWLSANGSGIRSHRMPGATMMVVPPSGGSGQGCTRPDGAAPTGN
jgi:hypothetical protein